jgi:hypothetical protein
VWEVRKWPRRSQGREQGAPEEKKKEKRNEKTKNKKKNKKERITTTINQPNAASDGALWMPNVNALVTGRGGRSSASLVLWPVREAAMDKSPIRLGRA